MKITAIVPEKGRRSGVTYYSQKLYSRLPATLIYAGQSIVGAIMKSLRFRGDLYHIQFEYRAFGSFPRSMFMLVMLSAVLSAVRPVTVTLHGVMTLDSLRGRRFRLATYFTFVAGLKISSLFVRSFVVHSELMRSVLERYYRIGKIRVIPHGTDARAFYADEGPKPNLVLFFGFIRPTKGIEQLIDAFGILRQSHADLLLTIAGGLSAAGGDRSEISYLNKVKTNSCPGVRFVTRYVSEVEKTQILSESTVVVLPYTDVFVEVSGVIHDIACYGVPVVCSDTPRFSEMTSGLNCIKVQPTTLKIAQAIKTLLVDPPLRRRLGENLKGLSETESWDLVAQKHSELYSLA